MRIIVTLLLIFIICPGNAQQTIYFGTIKDKNGIHQARFEVERGKFLEKIAYAPYGVTPVVFDDLVDVGADIKFTWRMESSRYLCSLKNLSTSGFVAYEGLCLSRGDTIHVLFRDFTGDDAEFQGNNLEPSLEDIQIIERAEQLLNSGRNWRRNDNRICDSGAYPDQWSLFCALHQASVDVAAEYRHIRPAMKAVRNAIQNLNPEKKYAHLLQDFNNDATSFETIAHVLHQAKETLLKDIVGKK
jgi:hypothetical protein